MSCASPADAVDAHRFADCLLRRRRRTLQGRSPAVGALSDLGAGRWPIPRAGFLSPILRSSDFAQTRDPGASSELSPRNPSRDRIESQPQLGRHAAVVPELESASRASVAGASARPADAGPLSLRPPGGRARGSTARAGGCWTRSSGSSRTMSPNALRKPSSTTILRSSRRSSPGSYQPLSHSVAEHRQRLRRRLLPTQSL